MTKTVTSEILTKQGVRNLDALMGAKRSAGHVHRFAPIMYTSRSNTLATTMRCYCGAEREETEDEAREREDAQRDAELDADSYSGGHHRGRSRRRNGDRSASRR